MKPIYGDRCQLLCTDTDSLMYRIETKDLYADMLKNLDWYDTSEYPSNHPCYSSKNKRVPGKMKDELNGMPMIEFVGLRAKMYSLTYLDKDKKCKSKKVGKGIARGVLKKTIHHDDYKTTLFRKQIKSVVQSSIRSHNHVVQSIRLNKIGLSYADDKRYILDDGIQTLPYGHYKIE